MQGKILRVNFFFLLFICSFNTIFSQEIEWANKIFQTKHTDKEYENNHLGMILGPPAIYPDNDYEKDAFDLYAEGYIIHPTRNKKELVDIGFSKAMNANQLCIAGIFNSGVVKKAYIILKSEKTVQVYSQEKNKDVKKFHSIVVHFNTETVYGVRLIIDHSKVNKWNIIKGIGLYKGNDTIKIKPDLFDENIVVAPREKLDGNINTSKCAEFNPKLSSDGSTLFFVRECGDKSAEEIFYAESASPGNWKPAVNIGKPLNNKGHNYVISNCPNPNILYVGNTYKSNGEEEGLGLSKSVLKEDGSWTLPEKVDIPLLADKEYVNYFVNFDQTAIIIVAEDKLNTANLDLYVSTYNKYKKEWDVPINLGLDINTEFAEDFPYLSIDGNTMFFCSNGRLGYGGYDVYITKRMDDSWTKWSKPRNLGPGINSQTDDFSFVVANSGDLAYLCTISTDAPDHHVDIYKVSLPKVLEQPALTSVKGKITNERNNEPVKATIKIRETGIANAKIIAVTTDKNGDFSCVLPHGKEYEIEIEAVNYFKIKDKISLTDPSNKNYFSKKYTAQPFLDSGQVSVMNNILFEFGTAKIKEASFSELDKLAQQLKEQNKSVVEISGHTDDVGADTFNLRLSRWRAGAVIDYLVLKGVRPWRLKINGYGENAPIAPNDTEEGRALNRRVEMTILEDDFTKKYSKRGKSKNNKLVARNEKS